MNDGLHIVLYLGLGLMTLAILLGARVLWLRSKGRIVRGEIVRHETQKISFRGQAFPSPLLVVRFSSPQAGEMECQVMASTHLPRFQVGRPLWVSYNPEKPEQMGRSLDQLLMGPLGAGFFGTMMLFVYGVKALGF